MYNPYGTSVEHNFKAKLNKFIDYKSRTVAWTDKQQNKIVYDNKISSKRGGANRVPSR